VERDVAFADATTGAHAAIDAAYLANYDRYDARIVGSVTGPGGRSRDDPARSGRKLLAASHITDQVTTDKTELTRIAATSHETRVILQHETRDPRQIDGYAPGSVAAYPPITTSTTVLLCRIWPAIRAGRCGRRRALQIRCCSEVGTTPIVPTS
jgi:hypothetical protein